MEDQNQKNNTGQADTSNTDETASASPSLDNPKLDLAEEYLNNWKRERADFVNYKKDEAKRVEEFAKFANESLVLEAIEVLDDLELTQKNLKNEGLGGVIKKFEDLLKKYGVERIVVGDPVKSPDGDNGASKFDPMLHEVIEMSKADPVKSPNSDNGASKIKEVRAGYTMHDRVIRPARIKIIK